ncbi:MAG: UvrD-helicase domain-containing protein [Treponema sp.]|nr:UvrD-helicase domain-containing protein [Treponema sp.]
MSELIKSEKRTPDKDQQAAIDARLNSVVSAGAGSGKTTVLAQRFSQLVLDKTQDIGVDQILTLTFTKKATVEMSDRIYKTLKENAPYKAADFFKANIKTLDSYCNSVAKMGCHYYGVAPDFTQDENAVQDQVYAMALPFLLEHRDNEGIKAIVSAVNFESLAQELFVDPILSSSTISEPIDFDAAIKLQLEEIVEKWNELAPQGTLLLDRVIENYENATGVNTTKAAYLNLEKCYGPQDSVNIETPEPPVITVAAILNNEWQPLADYINFLIKYNAPQPAWNAAGLQEVRASLKELSAYIPKLIPIFNYIYGYQYFKALRPLLEEFQDKVNHFKRSNGLLTFKDIANMAKCILRDYPQIRQLEKEKYRYIMIDEFQDNNSDQRDLLFMLAEKLDRHEPGIPEVDQLKKDKLFFVGDEKQSIYRFRGADVSVFNKLSLDFCEGNLHMDTNYRSDNALIAGFNTIFGGFDYPAANAKNVTDQNGNLIQDENIPSAFFSEKYLDIYEQTGVIICDHEAVYHKVKLPDHKIKAEQEAEEKNPGDRLKFYTPHIHFGILPEETEIPDGFISGEEAEARWVAEKINELCTQGIDGVKYEPNDIAILMRSYTLQPLYERTLLQAGIPYNTETVSGFFADGPVNDIFSLLRLVAYPEDTLAYSQILHSPWVNLNLEETSAVLLSTEKNKPFELLNKNILSEQSLEKFTKAKEIYTTLCNDAKRQPLTKTVSELWYQFGYRFETMWNKTVSMYSKMYDLIFELARKSDEEKLTLAAFVDSVRTYRDQAQRLDDMDIPLEQMAGVHILSIHKSKGLEYPVVFVCATHKSGGNDNNNKAVYTHKKFGITLNTPSHPDFYSENYFFSLVKDINKNETAAELRRLTYVALTRAKNHLFISNGKWKTLSKTNPQDYRPGGTNAPNTIFNVLQPVYDYYFETEEKPVFEKDNDGELIALPQEESGPFSREYIRPFKRDSENASVNNAGERIKLITKLKQDDFFAGTEILEKEKLKRIYANPSQLYPKDDESYDRHNSVKTDDANQEYAFDDYKKINSIINATIPKYRLLDPEQENIPDFSHANFGTIAHAYLEAAITGKKPDYSNREIIGLEGSKKSLETILSICQKMADSFKETPLGKEAVNSKWHKAEYSFRSRIKLDESNFKIIKGIIDLVFQDKDGNYTIVDYKTNMEIKPEIYCNQLTCYRQAISKMLGVEASEIKCALHYLRFNKTVYITDMLNDADLLEAVKALDQI